MDNRNYFTMAIPALLLGVAYLQPINAAPAEDLPNVTGRMTITQQTFTVSGVVTDTNGEPIIGANVIEKGTTNGAVTDFDGKFSLSLQNKQSILVVTYIGYNTKEIPAGNGSPLTIQLQDDTQNLDEVIVVGYSVQKKKDLTGAVSVLEVGDLKDTPVSSVDQMMQGKLSGVNVIPDNMPGGGVAVRVRGFSTIRNNDPLYIIDGVPVEGGINFLNPNDIESMQVLKDASSASIYGARAANGVVIISTKKGKEGTFRVNLDAYVGVQTSAKQMRMLNAQEYGDLLWQAQRNDGKSPVSDVYGSGETAVIPEFLDADHRLPSGDVDWVDEIMQKAMVQSYNLSLAKADKVSSHLFSLGYFNQDGLMKYTGFERISGRFNNEFKLFNDRLKIGENATLSHAWGTSVTNNAALGGMLYNAYKTVSITPVYDLDGNFGSYRISEAFMLLYKLFWDDFSGLYLEMAKPAYGQPIDAPTMEATKGYFDALMRVLHPFMPFVTEEIWQDLAPRAEGASICVAQMPEPAAEDAAMLARFELAKEIITSVRNIRNQKNLPQKEALTLKVIADENYPAEYAPVLQKMGNLSQIETTREKDPSAVGFLVKTTQYFVPMEGMIDIEAERKKLAGELEYLEGFLASVQKKLSNERFVSSAPEKVVANERTKQADAEAKIAALREQLAALK